MAFKKQRTTLFTDGEPIRQHDDPLDDPPAEIMKPPFTAFKDVEVVANLTNQEAVNNGIFKLWMLVKFLWAAREAGSTFEETEVILALNVVLFSVK